MSEKSNHYQPSLSGIYREAKVFQSPSPEQEPVSFPTGTVIYPHDYPAGTTLTNLRATKHSGKCKGLTAFISIDPIEFLSNTRRITLPGGTVFGAYVNKMRKLKS